MLRVLAAAVLTPALRAGLAFPAPEDPGPDESHRDPGSAASNGEDVAS